MDIPKINLHVHSNFSDGRKTINQIIKRALEYNINLIAITDHFSNSWKSKVIPTLDSSEKIQEYLDIISALQESSELTILKGIEIDIGSTGEYIKKLIKPEEFDLILFEYLESLDGLEFIENLIVNWKRKPNDKGDFPIIGLAHFNPFHYIQDGLSTKLIPFLKNNDLYFEFNSRYSQYYSRKNEAFFEELNKNNVLIALGTDAHGLRRLNDLEDPLTMIEYYGLKNNLHSLITKIKLQNENLL